MLPLLSTTPRKVVRWSRTRVMTRAPKEGLSSVMAHCAGTAAARSAPSAFSTYAGSSVSCRRWRLPMAKAGRAGGGLLLAAALLLALLLAEALLAAAAAAAALLLPKTTCALGASREVRRPSELPPSAGCAFTRSYTSLGTRTSHMRRPAWEMSTVVPAGAAVAEAIGSRAPEY